MSARYNGPDGIYLVIDTTDAATPAMVYSTTDSSLSSTFDCATGEGVLAGRAGDVELTERALAWLATHQDKVEDAYNVARKDDPEYN